MKLPVVIVDNKLWYLDARLKELRRVDNPHIKESFRDDAALEGWLDEKGYDPNIHQILPAEQEQESAVIGLDNDHSVLCANPATGEVWNTGEHFTGYEDMNAIEMDRVGHALITHPFFDYHTCTSSPDGSAVIIFNTEPDGTQEQQICTVPIYPPERHAPGENPMTYAEDLGGFVLAALRAFVKTEEGRRLWLDQYQKFGPPASPAPGNNPA